MADHPLKLDLDKSGCGGLVIVASFRFGRRALAEYARVTVRQLLTRGADFQTTYQTSRRVHHVIDGELRLTERFDDADAAERWGLTISCKRVSQPIKRAGASPFVQFMKKLGKAGLETEATITSWFLRSGEPVFGPEPPALVPSARGAFTHLVGFTLARLGELNELLYEATVRRTVADGPMQVEVGFTYRATLAEGLVTEVLARATNIAELTVRPPATTLGEDLEAGQDVPPEARPSGESGGTDDD